jgi:hypothetical protein
MLLCSAAEPLGDLTVLSQKACQFSSRKLISNWRKGRFGRILVSPPEIMGIAVSGSEEISRIRYLKGFCGFGLTGKWKMGILTLIFKSLIQDLPMILDFKDSRNLTNVIELPALTQWEPEQDLSQDARGVELPLLTIEERGRGTYVKKSSDVQHCLDYQVELQREIKSGIGLREGDRQINMWFGVPVPPAQSIQWIQDPSPSLALPLVASVSQDVT